MKYTLLLISILIILGLGACNHGNQDVNRTDSADTAGIMESREDITLTRDQFESMGMRIGDPLQEAFSNVVHVNGFVVPTQAGRVLITPMISGRVKSIHHVVGEFVRKGELLFTMESNDLVLLQQEYADAYHQLNLLKADYDRQKSLAEEHIIAQKDFIKTESEYMSMLSKAEGLRIRLRMINIDPEPVENGQVFAYISVTSPMEGTITNLDMGQGEFIEPQETVMEVLNTQKLQLQLNIFENDLKGVTVGQQVVFYTPGNEDRKYTATLSHLGKSVHPESRTVRCLALIDPANQGNFMSNQFVEAHLYTYRRLAMAIPEQALIKGQDGNYVLGLSEERDNQMVFRKIPINTGVTSNGFVEVLDDELKNLLLDGTYFLNTTE